MTMNTSGHLIAALIGTALTGTCFAQAGTLDPNFSADGMATVTFGTGNVTGYATVAAPNGDIYVAGTCIIPTLFNEPEQRQIAIVRLQDDGSLDTGFDGDGKVLGDFGPDHSYCEVRGMALQPDGKIVVVGNAAQTFLVGSFPVVDNQRFGIARFNADGTPDNTFSSDGATTLSFNTDAECRAWDVAIQGDGKIVVAGWTNVNDDDDSELNFAVARLNTNGSLDNSFSSDGRVQVDFGSYDSYAHAVTIQNDGKIVLAGTYDHDANGNTKMALARISSTGLMDAQFSGDGKYVIGSGSDYSDQAWDVTLNDDGHVVVVGDHEPQVGDVQPILLRLSSSGNFPLTHVFNAPQSNGGGFRSVEHQCDGKILACGYSVDDDDDEDFLIARIDPSGTLDATFSSNGMATVAFGSGNDVARGLFLRGSNQYATIAGTAGMPDDATAFGVARFRVEADIVPPAPVISFDQASCTLTASGTGTFAWQYSPTGFFPWLLLGGSGNSVQVSNVGYYRVRVTSIGACVSEYSDPFHLTNACEIPEDCLGVPNGPALPGTPCDDNNAATGNDTWGGDCVCSGDSIDCLGTIGGTALPGTPCDDGNAVTPIDAWNSSCVCVGNDCEGVPNGTALPGSPCDDEDANTGNDTWNNDCDCVGQTIDCEGVIGGKALPGTPCDDGNPDTSNDTWIIGCTCIGAVGIDDPGGFAHGVSVFPNPFQDALTVNFSLRAATELTIELWDPIGKKVATLLPSVRIPAGQQQRILRTPPDLANGIYLLVLSSPESHMALRVSK